MSKKVYDPEVELAKGANLTVSSFDKTQQIAVTAGKVTVGGKPGVAEITGPATGKGVGNNGNLDMWLSIFRFMRPDGTVNHVAGLNIPLALKAGQTPFETSTALADFINSSHRPYIAIAAGDKNIATLTITYKENE